MAQEKIYIITAKTELNIREGPGTDYEIVGTVPHGEKVLSPSFEGWVPILLEDDTVGWVFGDYLKEAPEAEAEPEHMAKPEPKFAHEDFPLFQKDLTDDFGTPDYGQFKRNNITTIDLSEFGDSLRHVKDAETGERFMSLKGHYLLEGPLKKALRLVCERNLAQELKTYDGCFVIRPMKSGRNLSVHSWALALDFNAATNPFQYPGPSFEDMRRDFSDNFVSCFAEAGFEWGGTWDSPKDPMHFQLPWTRDWRGSSGKLRPEVYSEDEAEPTAPEVPAGFDFSSPEGTKGAIIAECKKQGLNLPEQIAYVLATTDWETGHTFKPVKEAFWEDEDWRQQHLRYYPYYGRGYVQLTWKANYANYAKIMGLDLVNQPDLAMVPQNALFILVNGFKTGAFTGKKLTDYINEEDKDFYNARKCINGLDRAGEIAAKAKEFLTTIA